MIDRTLRTCYECGQICNGKKGISYHVRIKHGISYPEYLIKHELNGVTPTCQCGCGSILTGFFGGNFTKFVNGHQTIGIKRSDETRQKISDVQKGKKLSSAHKKKISISVQRYHDTYDNIKIAVKLANKDKKFSQEHKDKISITRKSRIASGEIVINADAISKTITQMYIDGGFQWCKGQYVSTKTGRTVNYRSSWELAYAKLLDNDPNVTYWEFEKFHLTYTTPQNKKRRYIPDFIVCYADGHQELVEVKPNKLTSNKTNIAKQLSAEIFCAEQNLSYVSWSLTGE